MRESELQRRQAEMRARAVPVKEIRQIIPRGGYLRRSAVWPDYACLTRKELVQFLRSGKESRAEFNEWLIRWTLSMQVRATRIARGWTQAELAQHSGLHIATVQRIENLLKYRVWLPRIASLMALANTFDVALIVRFESWGSVATKWLVVTPGAVVEFADDAAFLNRWAEEPPR